MNAYTCIFVQIGLVVAGASIAEQAVAAPPEPLFCTANAVEPASLDRYRGGFTTDTGIAVTLGIERIVSINGNLAQMSQVNLGDLGRLTSGQASLPADTVGQLRLIQNGNGSDFAVNMGQNALGGTVIQNTLNNQLITNQTVINATVNARGMLQTLNFQSTLANALNTAATGR